MRYMTEKVHITSPRKGLLQLSAILALLYLISLYNYLFFHILAELFTVIIAVSIFLIVWNSRKYLDNNYFLFIGIGFLTVGAFSLIHTLIYKGMGIIEEGGNANMATQLWLANRYITSLSFLIAPLFIKRKLNVRVISLFYLVLFVITIFSVFYWKIFPTAYIDGSGLTPFKIYSEYIISSVFFLSLVFFYIKRNEFNDRVFKLLSLVLGIMILAELMFTFYVGVYDFFNFSGHILIIIAFYLSYLGIIEYSLVKPYGLLFKNLKDRERELNLERNKFRGILNAMPDGVYMINENYEIEYINPALAKEFGPLRGNKCYEYLHDKKEICEWCKNKKVFEGKSVRWECHFPRNNKTYDLIDSPIITPEGIKAKLEILRDITEKKEIEKAKDEFISLASHQLRTPLSSIGLSSELLLRGICGEIPSAAKEYLEEIKRSTKRMSVMINNFLNISRIEMGNFYIDNELIDIPKLMKQTTEDIMPLIREKGLILRTITEENIPLVNFDENVLRITLDNLLTNAIRYTPKGGYIDLKTKGEKENIIISLTDNGCGIPKEQQNKIFLKSYRASNAKEITSQGLGLGLYMVKKALEKVNSHIWFESKLNEGTTFYVRIPLR